MTEQHPDTFTGIPFVLICEGCNKKVWYNSPTIEDAIKIGAKAEREKFELLISSHRNMICCPENCFCWDVEQKIQEVKE